MNDGSRYVEQALLPGLPDLPRPAAGDGEGASPDDAPGTASPAGTDAAPRDDQHLLPGFTLVALLDMDGTTPAARAADTADDTQTADADPVGARMHVFAPERPEPGPPPITVIGLGLDDALRPEALRILRQAETLALPRRLLKRFQRSKARLIPLSPPLEPALQALEEHRRQGRRCVVLADGDPLLYGIGASLARRLGTAGETPDKALRILPGLSALQTACARLALPWHDLRAVSLHGRTDWIPLAHAVLGGHPVGVYTDEARTPAHIARFLLERGVDWYRMAVAADLETPRECLRQVELHEAAGLTWAGGETVVLVPAGPARGPRLGLDESALVADAGLFTKAPVRAAALSLLGLTPDATLWDIGAGSGAVALEAAALVPRGRVFAVERQPDRVLCIQENRRRLGAPHLDIVQDSAPAGLDALPDPDAIFVGGGLSSGPAIHACETSCPAPEADAAPLLNILLERLKAGGTLVAACSLLSSLRTLTGYLESRGLPCELTQIQAAVSSPLAGSLTLKAHNPIMLVRTRKARE
ncbi:MAG: precorrin-6y C5,15-methyltransferase (decarboxylating) subunit CbiE [Desulfovibrionaceae bacterium]|nr:precorrin-6y C5,15-methyltransferase (decarboxylating) subunit CbiE [Desulfovibrionaceae bacterium]